MLLRSLSSSPAVGDALRCCSHHRRRLLVASPSLVQRSHRFLTEATDAPAASSPQPRSVLESVRHVLPAPGVDRITSTQNSLVKYAARLRTSRQLRGASGTVLLSGQALLQEVLDASPDGLRAHDDDDETAHWRCEPEVAVLFIRDDDDTFEAAAADWAGRAADTCRVVRCPVHVMRKISGLKSEDGATDAAAIMSLPHAFCAAAAADDDSRTRRRLQEWVATRCERERGSESHGARILVLDQVQDPGNLGTILRTALAFGWSGVVLTDGACDPLNEKALRASRGATFRLPIAQAKSDLIFDALAAESFDIYATVAAGGAAEQPEGVSAMLRAEQASINVALVFGSEGQGISRGVLRRCSRHISLPMAGSMESLNVGVAAGIMLYLLQQPR